MTVPVRRAGRARRYVAGRDRQVKLRYSETEYSLLVEAARAAGLTPSGYAAEAALAAARGVAAPSLMPLRQALAELLAARTQVRRFAVNVNQALKVLHGTGSPPPWLAVAVATTDRAVDRLDAAAGDVVLALRARPSRHGEQPPRQLDTAEVER